MQSGVGVAIFLFLMSGGGAYARDVSCTKEQLRQKNCLLQKDGGSYQFLRGNLSINDGVWKEVVKVPLEEKGTEWASLRLIERAHRKFYELKIWMPPDEGVSLQTLRWVIVELVGTKTELRLNQVIQKRRSFLEEKKTELMDKMEKHTLNVRGKKIHWTVGHLKGEF